MKLFKIKTNLPTWRWPTLVLHRWACKKGTCTVRICFIYLHVLSLVYHGQETDSKT